MNSQELIAYAAEKSATTKSSAKQVIDAYLEGVAKSLADGHDVTLHSIGKLSVKDTAERAGRNPSTGASIVIPAGKRLKFTPSKALKEAI